MWEFEQSLKTLEEKKKLLKEKIIDGDFDLSYSYEYKLLYASLDPNNFWERFDEPEEQYYMTFGDDFVSSIKDAGIEVTPYEYRKLIMNKSKAYYLHSIHKNKYNHKLIMHKNLDTIDQWFCNNCKRDLIKMTRGCKRCEHYDDFKNRTYEECGECIRFKIVDNLVYCNNHCYENHKSYIKLLNE